MKKKLLQIRATMEKINVSGKDDLDRMLGCIQALEDCIMHCGDETAEKTGAEVNA